MPRVAVRSSLSSHAQDYLVPGTEPAAERGAVRRLWSGVSQDVLNAMDTKDLQ
jgi:hypothetical protein